MGQRVILHRFEETQSGTLRVAESGVFDPDAADNPAWVSDALAQRKSFEEEAPRLASWKQPKLAPQPATVLDSVGFGEDTSEPDGVDEEPEPEEQVIDAAPQPATVISSVEFGGTVSAPPKSGPGSGKPQWKAHADNLGVEVTDEMTRDEIIEAVEARSE